MAGFWREERDQSFHDSNFVFGLLCPRRRSARIFVLPWMQRRALRYGQEPWSHLRARKRDRNPGSTPVGRETARFRRRRKRPAAEPGRVLPAGDFCQCRSLRTCLARPSGLCHTPADRKRSGRLRTGYFVRHGAESRSRSSQASNATRAHCVPAVGIPLRIPAKPRYASLEGTVLLFPSEMQFPRSPSVSPISITLRRDPTSQNSWNPNRRRLAPRWCGRSSTSTETWTCRSAGLTPAGPTSKSCGRCRRKTDDVPGAARAVSSRNEYRQRPHFETTLGFRLSEIKMGTTEEITNLRRAVKCAGALAPLWSFDQPNT